MFLSKLSFLESVEHDRKQLFQWDQKNNTFVDNQTIFNRLDDKGTGYQNGQK
jgi:hypothetical protein